MKDRSDFVVPDFIREEDLERERRAWERRMRVLCEIGVSRFVGRQASMAEEAGKLRRGESWGRSEIAERISGVVVRRTIARNAFVSLTHVWMLLLRAWYIGTNLYSTPAIVLAF